MIRGFYEFEGSDMPKHSAWVMDKELTAPIVVFDSRYASPLVFMDQIETLNVKKVLFQILNFQKNHGILDPVFDVIVLKVEPEGSNAEIRHISGSDHLLKPPIAIEASRYLIVFSTDKGSDGFGVSVHFE